MSQAVQRRCEQELGFATDLKFVYKFEYTAPFEDQGTEHELCSVYVGSYEGAMNINASEVSDVQWLKPQAVNAALRDTPNAFTPWFKLEWSQLQSQYAHALPASALS